MKVKTENEVAQLYPTLSDTMDRSLPGSSVHGVFQARVLEWVAIAFSDSRLPGFKSQLCLDQYLARGSYLTWLGFLSHL